MNKETEADCGAVVAPVEPSVRRVFDRPSKSWIELPDEYKLVYQGGHHNVYCNGARHYRTSGGFTRYSSDKMGHGFTLSCDCARWKSTNPFAAKWDTPNVG
jgi:hypothetical protein